MTTDDNQARLNLAVARKEVMRLRKEADREGLDSTIHQKVEEALRQAQLSASARPGRGPLDRAAVAATRQEERHVGIWSPTDLLEMFQSAVAGEWFDGENDGPYATRLVESWVRKHPQSADEYHLSLRSGKIVRYRQFQELLDRGEFTFD